MPTQTTGSLTAQPSKTPSTVTGLLSDMSTIGKDVVRGGYTRPVYSTAELELREWFIDEATQRGLSVEADRNGAIWAWWDTAEKDRTNALITGSHLDSVPGGGPFDGPLGIASALVALDILKSRGTNPTRPLAVVVFPEEEGSRFGVACLGSRLMTGAIDPDKARNLRDSGGNTFAAVAKANGLDPRFVGRDDQLLGQIGQFVELHVEQGRGLIELDQPIAIASSILGHGRWRLRIHGQGNHAGTTLMAARRDPMVAASRTVVAIRDTALQQAHARATVGRLQPVPGGTNVIASRVDFWLDVRHPDDAVTAAVVQSIHQQAQRIAAEEGCVVSLTEESLSPTVHFDTGLLHQLQQALPNAPILDTGAGHDAGILSAFVPTAMVFVRNPSGISHSPEEHVLDEDAETGAKALADALETLLA
ncbi:allantoate amidohydrolase [Paenarthrobacter nitroguajacolicus]|uniref:allantoate amidohydrolase n=1 Tax=Paenarthrobacter nitroguajacolicus TaxID=211146 RepID=UPI0028546D29|nr:allantoate amidohydrolase [Paenarthrobacter nitroguajacolicus]MDR6637007.1 N-carbamoyl-L-amino-acid hydrolase [Paenarthrobacter nitroguajacolicus]